MTHTPMVNTKRSGSLILPTALFLLSCVFFVIAVADLGGVFHWIDGQAILGAVLGMTFLLLSLGIRFNLTES